MRVLSGWATLGPSSAAPPPRDAAAATREGPPSLPAGPPAAWPREARARLGRMCKRLIDAGRARFLADAFRAYGPAAGAGGPGEAVGRSDAFALRTGLRHYCSEAMSLENCLLVGVATTT